MALPIDALVQGMTKDQTLELCLSLLETAGIPARSWRKRGVMYSLVGVVAVLFSMLSSVIAEGIKGNFLEWSTGAWLTILAKLVYGVDRVAATHASGVVRLTNDGGGVHGPFAADEIILVCTRTNARYQVKTAGWTLGALTFVDVDVMAVEAGTASSAAPGEIDAFESPLARVRVGNDAAIIGADAQSDPDLRIVCLASVGAQSPNGPRDAYLDAVLTSKIAGVPTSISRVVVLPALGTGVVRIVCATPSGAPSGAELDAARAAIEDLARTDTDTVQLSAAVEVPVARTLILWARGGDVATLRSKGNIKLFDLLSSYPIGGITKVVGGQGYLYADLLKSVAIGSSPEIFDADFVGSQDDFALAYNQVAVLTATLDPRVL